LPDVFCAAFLPSAPGIEGPDAVLDRPRLRRAPLALHLLLFE